MYLKPKKSLGQNFLRNQHYADTMVQALNLHKSDLVVEIGAGKGALTNRIITLII